MVTNHRRTAKARGQGILFPGSALSYLTHICSRERHWGQNKKTSVSPDSLSNSLITRSLKEPHLTQLTMKRRKGLSAGVCGG